MASNLRWARGLSISECSVRHRHVPSTIITRSNYASPNNIIGSLTQFCCVLACKSFATHANNLFHQRRKFQ